MAPTRRLSRQQSSSVNYVNDGRLESVKGDIDRMGEFMQQQIVTIRGSELECRLDILSNYIDRAFNLQEDIEFINPVLSSWAELEDKCVATKSLYMSATVQNRRPPLLN